MQAILALSEKSFRKAITSKIFVIFLLFAVGLIFLSILLEQLTFTAKLKIIKDVGLVSISIFTALLAIFLSGESIVGEIERKTVYLLFSKPVNKKNFILGNFLGIVWTVALSLVTTGGILLLLVFLKQGYLEGGLFLALGFIGLESLVISSVGIMFSSFSSSSITATFLCFFVYILGHLFPQLNLLIRVLPSKIIKGFILIAVWILPNLEYFNIRGKVVKGEPIGFLYTGEIILYTLVYSGIMLFLAYIFFRRSQL